MRAEVTALHAAISGGAPLPPYLDAVLSRLEGSAWPEVVTSWSRLNPSGFPIELTAAAAGEPPRWTAEVAGPETPERDRLDLAAGLLAAAGQPAPQRLLSALRAAQSEVTLRFGAWLGGREKPGTPPRLKLYAELPAGAPVASMVPEIQPVLRQLPPGAAARMLGIEPARHRTELYLRLPDADPVELAPALHALGHGAALTALDRGLPDGLRRLRGRRLGLSLAWRPLELALFVPAYTLFPAVPELLGDVAPQVAGLDLRWRPGAVTLGLDPAGRTMPVRVGLAPGRPSLHHRNGYPQR